MERIWLKQYPGRRARRHRHVAIRLAGRIARRELRQIPRPQSLHLHGQGDHLSRTRRDVAGARRLSAKQGPEKRCARRADDAERAAISGRRPRPCCAPAMPWSTSTRSTRRASLSISSRIPAPKRSSCWRISRTTVQQVIAQNQRQARHRRQHGRHARLQGHDRQFRGAPRQEDGAAVVDSGCGQVQRRARRRSRHEASTSRNSRPTMSPSCNIPAAPPASRRARRCFIATSSPTCCRTTRGCSRR